MRQFAILIDKETRGPFPEAEIRQMIATGKVTPDTPCAPDGSAEWEPLSRHFSFGSKLRISSQPLGGGAEADDLSDRLFPEERRKLVLYGLATHDEVDGFTQSRAEAAIAAHEQDLRRAIRRRKTIGQVAFLAALALASALGLASTTFSDLVSLLVSGHIRDERKSTVSLRSLDSEIRRFESLRKAAEGAVFAKPQGGAPPLPTLMNRLKVDEATAYRLRGAVDIAPLAAQVAKWKIEMNAEDLRVYVLSQPMPAKMLRNLTEQSSVLDTILSPLLDETGFATLRAQIAGNFPTDPSRPESARLKAEADKMQFNDLDSLISRVEFHAAAAEKEPGTLPWGQSLRDYALKLRELRGRSRINADPSARRELWNEFSRGTGAELSAWVITSGAREAKVSPAGIFVLNEAARINPAEAGQRVLVTTRINGDTVYLAWGSKYLSCRELQCDPIPRETLLQREDYKIVAKPTTGDRRFVAKGMVNGRELTIERKSPRWHFLSVARDGDRDTLMMLVDEKAYASYQPGSRIPISELLRFEFFVLPAESPTPSPLTAAE